MGKGYENDVRLKQAVGKDARGIDIRFRIVPARFLRDLSKRCATIQQPYAGSPARSEYFSRQQHSCLDSDLADSETFFTMRQKLPASQKKWCEMKHEQKYKTATNTSLQKERIIRNHIRLIDRASFPTVA